MNDKLALVWLNDLLEQLERSPQCEDPVEYYRRIAVRHAIKVIRWREKLLRLVFGEMEKVPTNE